MFESLATTVIGSLTTIVVALITAGYFKRSSVSTDVAKKAWLLLGGTVLAVGFAITSLGATLVALTRTPPAFSALTVFDAEQPYQTSGGPVVLDYNDTILNPGTEMWDGRTFTAPRGGVYAFQWSFVRQLRKGQTIHNDTQVTIRVNGVDKAVAFAPGSTDFREEASAAATLRLDIGDKVDTVVTADKGDERTLLRYAFTGFSISEFRLFERD